MKKASLIINLLILFTTGCGLSTVFGGEDSVAKTVWQTLGGNFQRTGLSENPGPETGCIKWQFETEGAVVASITIGSDGRVHVPCQDGKLYALDPNGSLIWSFDANTPVLSAPTIGPDGTVYIGSQSGRLFAVTPDGSLRWTYDTGGFIFSSPAVSEEGNVYFGSEDGTLYALAQDGSLLWSFNTNGPGEVLEGSILASPAIGDDGTVYIGGLYDPNLYAIDPNDGSIKWKCQFESDGWPFVSPVIADDGTIYQSLLYDSNLYVINPDDGTIIRSTDLSIHCDFVDNYILTHSGLPPIEQINEHCEHWIQFPTDLDTYSAYMRYKNAYCWSEPALGSDGTIYVSFDDPYLRAVDPNGTMKWATALGTLGGFTLTVGGDGNIYAASDDGFLYVVNPNGENVAQFQSDSWLNYPVIAPDNTIIVADSRDNSMLVTYEKNKVYAISSLCPENQTPDLCKPEDLNSDGIVNSADLALLAMDWLNKIYE